MSGPKEACSSKRTAAAELTGEPEVVSVTLRLLEVPPPGTGLVTMTGTLPACALVALPMAVTMLSVT